MLYKTKQEKETENSLLSELLGFFMTEEDAEKTAKQLINEFGCIKNVLSSSAADLHNESCLTEDDALMLEFFGKLIKYAEYERFGENPALTETEIRKRFVKVAIEIMPYEDFYLFLLDGKGRLIKIMPVSHGSESGVEASRRVVVDTAVKYGAKGVVAVHTHPAATSQPSVEDIKTTNEISILFKKVDIQFIDHIIVGKNGVCSMKEGGII